MKRLKGDILWGFIISLWILILIFPKSRGAFLNMTEVHPYVTGFIKFSILAPMGDLLGVRIIKGEWSFTQGFIWKAIVWGILGMMITLVFSVFVAGTSVAQVSGKLPFKESRIALAIFASIMMNMTFGPMLYIYYKFGELIIDLTIEKKKGMINHSLSLREMVNRIDWYGIVSFSWLKTCILIWMPCHAIVFLLPEQYRVLASALLSVLLGVIISIGKKDNSMESKPS